MPPIIPYYARTQPTDDAGAPTAPAVFASPVGLPLPSEVRTRWCFGLPLTTDAGNPMTDDDLYTYLKGAVRQVERELGIYLKPTVIVANAEARGLEEGVDYEVDEAPYDYDARAWSNYGFLQLRERPMISLEEFKLVLPNNQVIMDFLQRPEWVKPNRNAGQLRIVPYAGDPSLFNMAGGTLSGFAFVTGAINGQIPQSLYVSYTAGYAIGKIPDDVRNIIGKIAAIDALGIAGDAIMAGISSQSTSIDGLSESFSTSASATSGTYSSHIKQMQDEVDSFFDVKKGAARTSERGFTMTGL